MRDGHIAARSTWLATRVKSLVAPAAAPTLRTTPQPRAAEGRPQFTALPWRRILGPAVLMWIASLLIEAAVTYYAVILVPTAGTAPASASLADLVLAWRRHDTYWYLRIAQGGYYTEQVTAFFPLYPALIRLVVAVIGPHWTVAALVASNLAKLGVFVGLALFAANEWNVETAWRTVMIAMAAPLAFFFAAPMSESVFLAPTIFSLLFARRGNWLASAVCALLAGLTRPTAVALVPALLWEFGRQHGWWRRPFFGWGRIRGLLQPQDLVQATALLGAVPLAIAALMGYFWVRFGHPLLIIHSHTLYWGRNSVPVWQTLGHIVQVVATTPALSSAQALQLLDAAPVFVVGVLMIAMARQLPLSFTLYTAGVLYFAISTPITNPVVSATGVESAGRFLLVAFPIYAGLALWSKGRAWLEYTLLSGGFLLQGVVMVFFLHNGWIV